MKISRGSVATGTWYPKRASCAKLPVRYTGDSEERSGDLESVETRESRDYIR